MVVLFLEVVHVQTQGYFWSEIHILLTADTFGQGCGHGSTGSSSLRSIRARTDLLTFSSDSKISALTSSSTAIR